MPEKNFSIKRMTKDELELAIDWAAQEGWNPGVDDLDCYYSADPEGFLIGYLDDEPIASISVVKYDDSFGFLGFYIVIPKYRGQGYGIQIWQAGMEYLTGCNVGLDGVVDQQDNYKKSGFTLAYRNIRYAGMGGEQTVKDSDIIPLKDLPFDIVEKYDNQFFPAKRTTFLQQWISQEHSQALGILSDDKLTGYGVIRACREGYKVGPLYADTPELAERLFIALRSTVPSTESIYLDVPEINQDAVELAKRHNMQLSFETARMYTKERVQLPFDKLYGVTSFEIG